MDTDPSHWFYMLLFVVGHFIPAWLAYEAMMYSDRKHKRRAMRRPWVNKINSEARAGLPASERTSQTSCGSFGESAGA